ncbi:bifunctional UDP-N-acetylglucosamine diphosphorylase/glucosamine-1-phosphate N-acetyltransferase GlmU [Schaalia sp. lx-100]|uniref:bifunctional UDP-N-acetylglucosamine diphosphorylase/glucosamine-1-phosphate N-acetyltransferase GlmU n=1 Tax=Schaalia sp. lx-100 TaxID=2899081 RepID=UPI001E6250FD|nr:NTP transferase domain-containing protein [Schaalia sp. lx-100]MCD4557256.1 NTP transferase domain-containing protein [Schaalia sp. lx-100]
MTHPAAVIVLAAGQGTRMKSDIPKVAHPLAGISMIGHAVRAALALQPEHLVAVVRHQREIVADEILRFAPHALIADQDEIPGTGRAVQCAVNALENVCGKINGTIVVTYGDVPMLSVRTLEDLVAAHEEGSHAVTVLTAVLDDPTGYGRIIRNPDGIVTRIVEQRDATPDEAAISEVNAGIYAFDAQFLRAALHDVKANNAQGEVYLTDVLAAAAPAGRTVGALIVEDHWQIQGCNDRVQLAQLGAEFNRRICQGHMRAGVSIPDPMSTWIDVDVTIGPDTTIFPATVLRGRTTIGSRCLIGPGATLIDTQVGHDAHVPTAWTVGAQIDEGEVVVPFSVRGQVQAG